VLGWLVFLWLSPFLLLYKWTYMSEINWDDDGDDYLFNPQFTAFIRNNVCPSVTRVDQSKTVEVRIMQLSPSE